MRLILCRHGNTFNADETPVMAGLKNDLALVEEGGKQAERMGRALRDAGVVPTAVLCSELRRTHRFAEIVMEQVGLVAEPMVDARLNELDYGEWTGKSDAEVIDAFGTKFNQWQKQWQWPRGCGWGSDEATVQAEVAAFLQDLTSFYNEDETVVAVCHNGRMRYFLSMLPGERERRIADQSFKVKTGHAGIMLWDGDTWRIDGWNMSPVEVVTYLNKIKAKTNAA